MILLVYTDQNPEKVLKHLDTRDIYTEIVISSSAARINNYLAEQRGCVSRLLIQRGMPDSEVMVGDCHENKRKIPIDFFDSLEMQVIKT